MHVAQKSGRTTFVNTVTAIYARDARGTAQLFDDAGDGEARGAGRGAARRRVMKVVSAILYK
jgi:hypothetical protein